MDGKGAIGSVECGAIGTDFYSQREMSWRRIANDGNPLEYGSSAAWLFPGVMAAQNVLSAQVSVYYDAEDDGLIEGEWLQQLDTVRWGLSGYGQ